MLEGSTFSKDHQRTCRHSFHQRRHYYRPHWLQLLPLPGFPLFPSDLAVPSAKGWSTVPRPLMRSSVLWLAEFSRMRWERRALVPGLGPETLGLFLVAFLHSCHRREKNTSHPPTDPRSVPRGTQGREHSCPAEPSVAQPAHSRHVSEINTSRSVARRFFLD